MKGSDWWLRLAYGWTVAAVAAPLVGAWVAIGPCIGALAGALQCFRYARKLEAA